MATPQSSILRQAILGEATPSDDENPALSPAERDQAAWDRNGDSAINSTEVRPPGSIRWSGGHAGHMKLLFENAPVAMAMFDTEMRYLLANRRWLEDFKLVDVDFVGRCQYDLFPGLHPGWKHVYERALGGQIVRSDRDAVTQHGRPVLYRWEVGPWRHPDTTIGGVMISCERLYAAPAEPPTVQESQYARVTGDGLWESGLPLLAIAADGRIVKASHGAAGLLLGVPSRGEHVCFWEIFGEETDEEALRRNVLASLETVLSAGRAYTVMITERESSADLPTQWLVSRLEGESHGVAGEVALVIGLPGLAPFSPETGDESPAHGTELQELTEQLARMQAAVKESAESTTVARQREARLRAVLDLAPCGLIVLDDHARPIYHNAQVALLLGRALREGSSIEEWLAEGARDDMHQAEIARRWTEGVWRKHLTLPLALTAADGLLREIEMRPAALPGGGLLVLMQDVTESRRAEEMLRSTEAKYRTLVHESPVPIILADRTSAVFDVNPAAEALLGHTRAELRRMGVESWLDEDGITARAQKLAEMQELGERSASLKLNLVTRTGASAPVDLRLALVTDGGGQLLFSIHFFSPVITAQPAPAAPQVAVSAPIPRETRTHAMLLLTTDVHGRVQEWSDDATERFGYEPSEIIGRGLHLLFSPSDATGFYSNLLALAANDGAQPASIEWTFFHKSEGRQQGPFLMHLHEGNGLAGSLMEEVIVFGPVSPDAAAVADDTEDSRVVPLLLDDVPPDTARPTPPVKPTQEDLSRERILLGEAHHRVKNHLQIITSMLNLQMSTVHNDEARDALRSSQNRVRSIAALHQHLFQLTTGATADFQSFASGLIGHLRECYQVDEQRVPLQLTVPDRPVPEEWLMPLALSLNEMVANAFKHAYAGHREGSMSVTLSWDDAGGELSVVDDGAGLPSGFSHHDSAGLGLKILRVFAGQLGGEVRIEGNANQGTAFRLTFPVLSDEIAQESPPDS